VYIVMTPRNKTKRKKQFRKTRSKTRSKRQRGGVKRRNTSTGRYIQPTSPSKSHTDLCSICLDDLKQNNKDIHQLPCKHEFHTECLAQHCNIKDNINVKCPLCRADITSSCISDINPSKNKTRKLI